MGFLKKFFPRSKSGTRLETKRKNDDNYESAIISHSPPSVRIGQRPASVSANILDTTIPVVTISEELLSDDVRDYYYPNMDKIGAIQALRYKPVGTFLLRHSQCPTAKYTLSIRSERHVVNVRIFNNPSPNSGYHLDAPNKAWKYFQSISALLNHYAQEPRELVALCNEGEELEDKTCFKLVHPLSRSENALNSFDITSPAQRQPTIPIRRPINRQTNGGSLKLMRKLL